MIMNIYTAVTREKKILMSARALVRERSARDETLTKRPDRARFGNYHTGRIISRDAKHLHLAATAE